MAKKLTKQIHIDWLEKMELIREFETKCQMLYGQNKIRGFLHLYIGQEAVAVGTASAIKEDDKVITAYRDHGHALALGMSPDSVMAELFGKKDGCSKGKGGSMHLFSKEHNFFGGHGIVGGAIPLGAGMAFSEQYKESGNVVINFFGDGASLQGSLYETFNMAMTWKLPCVFVIENNKYGMGTAIDRITNVPDLYKKACAFDMPSEQVDGMNAVDVHKAIEKAAERARNGEGPTLLEMITYRYKGHSISDPAKYRSNEEVSEYKDNKDPIKVLQKRITDKEYLSEDEMKDIKKEAKSIVKESIEFAENSSFPEQEDIYDDVYVQDDYPFLKD